MNRSPTEPWILNAATTDADNPMANPIDFALISNQPTPYRVHLLQRIAAEMPLLRLHSIFTHAMAQTQSPWQMQINDSIRPVFFENEHLSFGKWYQKQSLRAYRRIRDYLIQNNVKLIVQMGYADLTAMLLIRWAKRAGIPLLLNVDSNVFSEGRLNPIKRLVKQAMIRRVTRQVAGLMPMGTCGLAYFRSYIDHDKPEFLFPYEPDYRVWSSPDPDRIQTIREQFDFSPQRQRMVYCGRLVQVKRVDVLIDAFAQIAADCPDWDLVIIGEGELRQSLAARIPEPLRHRVIFTEFLQVPDIAACFACCDVLVHPSEYEPWALVINEAVAAGLAVISSNVVGASRELVRHQINGLLVPPRDPLVLGRAIQAVTQNGRCNDMKQASARVLREWRQTADPIDGLRHALEFFNLNRD